MTLALQIVDILKKSCYASDQEKCKSTYTHDDTFVEQDNGMELVFVFIILLGLSEAQSLVGSLPNKIQQVCSTASERAYRQIQKMIPIVVLEYTGSRHPETKLLATLASSSALHTHYI